jgi:small subunit ribosomal protein S21
LDIKVNDNNVDGALKVLKRKLQREGLFKEIKRRDAKKQRMKSVRYKKRIQ